MHFDHNEFANCWCAGSFLCVHTGRCGNMCDIACVNVCAKVWMCEISNNFACCEEAGLHSVWSACLFFLRQRPNRMTSSMHLSAAPFKRCRRRVAVRCRRGLILCYRGRDRPTVVTAMPGISHKNNLDFRMPLVSRLRL